jgi:hypothetical protein
MVTSAAENVAVAVRFDISGVLMGLAGGNLWLLTYCTRLRSKQPEGYCKLLCLINAHPAFGRTT